MIAMLAVLLAIAAGTTTAFAATETVSLGVAEETTAEPDPLLESASISHPVTFKVTYTATPVQPLEIWAGLNCVRGSETPGVPFKPEIVTPPASMTLYAPAESDSCFLTASTETPVMTTVFGTVKIEAEAVVKAIPSQPAAPAKKKCGKKKRLKHSKCVKKGKKRHLHQRRRR
jgi:hypothetical protein